MLALVSSNKQLRNSKFLSFNLSMFTEADGTTINNEDRKKLQLRNFRPEIFLIFS